MRKEGMITVSLPVEWEMREDDRDGCDGDDAGED